MIIAGLKIDHRDIIKWSEGFFSIYFDGTAAGVPDGRDVAALSSEIEPCKGDFDSDGDVDDSDLSVFAADFGRMDCRNGPFCEGDFGCDGDVDGSDLAVFADDFGRMECP